MYRRILVALDGSELAERALPHAEAVAEQFGATVTLLRVITPLPLFVGAVPAGMATPAPVADPTPMIEAERQAVAEYLVGVAPRLRRRGIPVDYEHPDTMGPTASVIVERARALRANLIVMTTHGRGGLGRLVFGSVADAVLRNAPCPILLVRVSEDNR